MLESFLIFWVLKPIGEMLGGLMILAVIAAIIWIVDKFRG